MENITVIIPTFDRPEMISCQLAWFVAQNFSGQLMIADASTDKIFSANRYMIESSHLNVTQIDCRGLPEKDSTKIALDSVTTEFVCWTGDDDFQLTIGMRKSAEFLGQNRTVGAARGQGIRIYLDRVQQNKHGFFCRTYDAPHACGDTSDKRLQSYIRNGCGDTHYSMHRTEILQTSYKDVDLIESRVLGAACLPIIMTLRQANVVRLSHLSLFKGVHSQRYKQQGSNMQMLHDDGFISDLRTLHLLANDQHEKTPSTSETVDDLVASLVFNSSSKLVHPIEKQRWLLQSILASIRYAPEIRQFKRFYNQTKGVSLDRIN